MNKILVLASQSPFRKKQMEDLGFQFETLAPTTDERALENSFRGPIEKIPQYLAHQKALSVAPLKPGQIIIGSDQLLIVGGKPLHKPQNIDEVMERLGYLQGKTHELHTALCLIRGDEIQGSTTIAKMTMKALSDKDIQTYAQLDQPIACAGGYKIEENGGSLFSKIETDDRNSIVGLPTLSLIEMLENWGISRL